MKKLLLILFCAILFLQVSAQQVATLAPSNNPAEVKLNGKELTVSYDNKVILTAILDTDPSTVYLRQVVNVKNGAVSQVFSLTSANYKNLSFSGYITGSEESFPCETEQKQKGTVVVRHTYGLSSNRLNRAVYDRKYDWVLSLDNSDSSDPLIESVEPTASGNKFRVTINGDEIVFRFRPHYYQQHRGFKYFEPWNYKVWNKPVSGWCSWYPFMANVSEKDIKETADVLSEKLLPFGLNYLQLDMGYEQQLAEPEKWIHPNAQFPSGLEFLSNYISSKGLKPGIWTGVSFNNEDFVKANKKLFVTDNNGEPAKGRWIGYVMDGSNQATLDKLVKPIYSTFKQMGWKYYKVDFLRHLRYEGYNSNAEFFAKKKVDRIEAFRNVVKTVRNEIGRDNYLLACWGIRPELTGIIDGCRIGGDSFSFESLSKFNSLNNIIWQNDPDAVKLTAKKAYLSCMVTSLTGSLFLLSDKPEVYRTPVVEAARRSVPVLFTLPGQLFDVDPSCSDKLDHIATDLSGVGGRAVDGNYTTAYDLFQLEINKPFENWTILGRAGESTSFITFADLGLSDDKEYLVFEFWTKKYIGSFTGGFDMGKIDPTYNCQNFCIRQRLNRPQILATNRHITCGALELADVEWKGKTLSGKSDVVANDSYTIYVSEPEGATFKSFSCDGVKITDNNKSGTIRQITVVSAISKTIGWSVDY